MTITFENIGAETTELPPAIGAGTLSLRGWGWGLEVVPGGEGFGSGRLRIYGTALANSEIEEPTYVVGEGYINLVSAFSYGPKVYLPATGDGVISLLGFGYESPNFGWGNIALVGFGVGYTEDIPAPPPPFIVTEFFGQVDSDMASDDEMLPPTVVHALIDRFVMTERWQPLAKVFGNLLSNARATDFITAVFDGQLDSAAIAEDEFISPQLVALLADQLVLLDEATSQLNALLTIASVMVMADRVRAGRDAGLEDTFEFTSDVEAQIIMLAMLASEVSVLDELEPQLLALALLTSDFQMGDTPEAMVSALVELLDSFNVAVRLRTDAGDEFAGYSLNVTTSAVSEYDNYEFNSLARVGNRYFGANEQGIYLFGGDQDDGEPIPASFRTGLTNFGTTELKRPLNAYIGYTSDGQLMLGVTTTDNGVKKTNKYLMKARPQGTDPVDNRFDIAKGLHGVYLGFSLENVDGSDFDVDIIKVWTLTIPRRYSGR